MPGDLDGDKLERAMVGALRDVTMQLGAVREQIKEDVAQQLRSYREDSHRAIMAIYTRLVSIEDTIETDRGSRVARQKQHDAQIAAIQANQRFLVRLAVIAGLVAIGVVIGWWLL